MKPFAGKTVLEADLRSILRDESRFPFGTVSFCEFAKGGDPGIPDSWIAGGSYWIPCELKRGNTVCGSLRPSQKSWHKNSLRQGIKTYGMTILPSGDVVRIVELYTFERKLIDLKLADVKCEELTYVVLMDILSHS